jgi:small redox-active disulfide protein 2
MGLLFPYSQRYQHYQINISNQQMKIQVLGSGCSTCKNLFELTKTAVADLGLKADVEYSTDISKIIEMGVMQSPVLAIDGKPAMTGAGNLDKIKAIISKGVADKPEVTEKPECTCGGNCC